MDYLTAWIKGEHGRLTGLARFCGVTHSAVWQWKAVPAEHVRKVSEFTGIEPALLRPDLYEGMSEAV